MSERDNIQAIIAAKKKALEEAKNRVTKEREVQPKEIKPSANSMNKLQRLILTDDKLFFCKFLHPYSVGKDCLIHTWDDTPTAKNSKGRIVHIYCTDTIERGTCKYCKKYFDLLEDGKPAYSFEPKSVKAIVPYVYNLVGQKRTFTGDKGEPITYTVNPVQVLEVQTDKANGETVLSMFKSFDNAGMFENNIWSIVRKPGVPDARGFKRGGGFDLPETMSEEELEEKLGSEGFSIELPQHVKEWSERIKSLIKPRNTKEAEDELFKYILTSFENAQEVADMKGIELPKKQIKSKDEGSIDSLSS